MCACPWEASDIVLREFSSVRHEYAKTTGEELQVLKEYRRVRDELEAAVTVTFNAGLEEDVKKFIIRFEMIYHKFEKNVTKNNVQGFMLPDCVLKAGCKAKIDRRVAAIRQATGDSQGSCSGGMESLAV